MLKTGPYPVLPESHKIQDFIARISQLIFNSQLSRDQCQSRPSIQRPPRLSAQLIRCPTAVPHFTGFLFKAIDTEGLAVTPSVPQLH